MRMEDHHIYRQSDAFDRADYSEFTEYVLSLIAPERASGVKSREKSRFKEIHRTRFSNGVTEATFKREMLEHIVKDDIQVLAEPGDPSQGIQPVYSPQRTLPTDLKLMVWPIAFQTVHGAI